MEQNDIQLDVLFEQKGVFGISSMSLYVSEMKSDYVFSINKKTSLGRKGLLGKKIQFREK